MWHDGQFTYRLTLPLGKGRIPSQPQSMQQLYASGSNLEVRQQQEDGIMLNGTWYRMTEKQDMESPSESGIEFEAFNISEAKRISTRAAEGEGDCARPGGIDGQAARGVSQRRDRKMDGRGRDIRLRALHGSGHSSSRASLFRFLRVRSSSRLEPRSIQSRSRSGIPVPDSGSFPRS